MPIKRREALYLLAGASGWPMMKGRTATAEAIEARLAGESISNSSQAKTASNPPVERVLGIGGLFFRAHDPKALGEWYRIHLGLGLTSSGAEAPAWHTEAGTTAFQPFSLTSKYLGDPQQMWMVNFRVRNLDRMAAQLRSAGIEVAVDPQNYPYGRFARMHDPEGNPIELWEPAERDASPQ